MNPAPTTPITAPARPRRRRWLRVVLIGLAILFVVPLAFIGYSRISRERAWNAAIAEAERDLPRWRLMELEEDRPKIPDAENSALHMIAVNRKAGAFLVLASPNYEPIFEKLTSTARLNVQQEGLIRAELAKIPNVLPEARKLKDMPRGRYPVRFSDDFISTLIQDHQDTRQLANWLYHDAYLLAHDGEADRAVESCQAILNAGRALDGDPFLIAHLIRLAMQAIHVTTLERVLAQAQPSDPPLESLQALLAREIKESTMLLAVRGERAGFNHLFENIRSGRLPASTLRGIPKLRRNNGVGETISGAFLEVFPSTWINYYPEYLQDMNRGVEIVKLPIHERAPQLAEWGLEVTKSPNPLIRTLAPSLANVGRADSFAQASLRAAMAGIACERYRLKHGEFPASLDALVKAKLIDAVPIDPCDNQPLRYRRTKAGAVIYSIGQDGKDDQGNIDNSRRHEPGVDVGFRLWTVANRRQPPLPIVAIVEGKK